MRASARGITELRFGDSVAGRVSVVVPTRNSVDKITNCLSSICAQSYSDVEVIVVDNHSTDGTIDIAREFADLAMTAGPERSAQRNIGATQSTGEFLVFIDSDMILPLDLIADVVRTFQSDSSLVALVLPERATGEGFWARCRMIEKELYLGDRVVEAARGFRRSIFVQAGGYDERIYGGGEDWDLPDRILLAGGGIGRVKSIVIHDEGRLTLFGDLAKKMYYGRSLGLYVHKHRGRALQKVARFALVRRPALLARDPLHTLGLLVMKTLELIAVLLGMISAQFSEHPATRMRAGQDV